MDDLDLLFIQQDLANELSTELDRFRIKSHNPYKANARCPVCGDSAKSISKARFWILEADYNLVAYCHNCGYNTSFLNFLSTYYPNLYQSYLMDTKIKKKKVDRVYKENPKIEKKSNPIAGLQHISENEEAFNYIKQRKIPEDKWDSIYYTDKYYAYINTILPDKFSKEALKYDHPRIVIPFLDIMGDCFGVQGRAISGNDDHKYITIMFSNHQKIFGVDTVDWNKTVYCVEGPFDSLFIPNSIAMAGSDINISKQTVIVLDNEPRNTEILAKYDKYITKGHPVCLWPATIKEKDINDMILSGLTSDEIKTIIDKNTYSGIKAKLKLKNWRKI